MHRSRSTPTRNPSRSKAAGRPRPSKPPRGRAAIVAVCALGLAFAAAALSAAAVRATSARSSRPSGASAPAEDLARASPPARARAWRASAEGSPLAGFADAAFAAGGLVSTDGTRALFAPAGLAPRPLEVSVPIRRVFAGAGRLFAQGENEGAPFLVALADGEALVVPMPCALNALAGEGDLLLGACDQGGDLAESDDGGRTFRKIALSPPAAPAPAEAEVTTAVEAVAVDADGAVAAVVARRWESEGEGESLHWTFAQVALRGRGERSFRFAPVPGLARALAARLSGGALAVAGIAVDAEGWLEEQPGPRLRAFRGPAGQAPLPAGAPGPLCALTEEAEGVLLDSEIGAFRCGKAAVLMAGGGARWLQQEGLGPAEALRGGEMRLALRAGRRVFELRFPLRQASGAVAERAALAAPDAGSDPPLVPAAFIAEPARDGGAADGAR